ncbi:zinc fingers and homeoboxes protein 3 isoform X2 [Alosa sapidissima]|uniref:zinc fingers and homeoboxes protein 3 isoform X2 n=1 Tax=Alosa sapidissima TaxID=34773 RepID=UPI001C085BA5|nr:zinc fingers and homeoboxes protein 3 isoform X2 [Alosa sapidissima]
MASKRKSTIPCMIPVKTMYMRDDTEHDLPCTTTKDSAYASREDLYGQGYLDVGEPSRHDSGDALKDGGTYTCRPCNFETLDLNLFLDHVYSGHPEFRSDPSFHCVDCGVTAAKFEGLALHNARVHPSTVTTTLQLRKRDRKVTVEQSLILGPGDSLLSKSDSEISITKTPIMKMLKGKSEHKRIVVSHSAADDSRLEAGVSVATGKPAEKKDPPSVTVTHVPTIVHNGSTSKVTLPSAIQIVNGSGALPILKTAVTQVVSVVQNRNLHQHSTPITMSSSPSSSSHSSKNLPKVMIPLSSIPTYNAAMDNSSFLKTSFSKFPYPTKAELCYLTVVTKYPEEQIKIWFTAQRLKQGISWSPEEIEEARRKMFNTIIQTAPPSGHHHHTTVGRQTHHGAAQQTITVLPASLGATGIPHILQGSLVSQGGVIVTQPMMANGIQVSSAPVALAVTPKPQSAAKPMMQARPAAALVADKGVSMVVGTVGSSSSLNYTICSSSSSNGGVSSSCSSNASSSSSIISSSSSSSRSNSSNSGSSGQTSVISTGGGTIITTTISNNNNSSNGKTSTSSSNNINSNTTKTNNGNKSTENGKSAVNGKGTAPSAANTKTNQDVKSGSNSKDSSSSTVKSTNDGKASPDIKTSTDRKISTDAKSDSKTDSKSNGTSLTTTTTTTSASNTNGNINSTSATTANTAAPATVTTTSGQSSSSKKGETATAAAASSPSTSASTTPNSRTLPNASFLDANSKQNKKSQEQLSALKQSFLNNQFPNQDEVNRLTSLTGLSVREVRKWFSDRRYHFRNLKGPRTSTGGQASGTDKTASPGPASGASVGSSDTAVVSSADRPKTPPPTPTSPPQQQQQTTSPTTPSRRPPRPPSPDFTAIRYKEREPHQLVALEASFLLDPEPSSEEVDRLRQETKMTRREIHGWFAERRKRAAAEKKKEEAEKAEKEEAEACREEGGEKSEPVKEEVKEEKMNIDEHSGGDASSSSSSSQQGKDEKQKDDAPKVNPIKINLKMLKVTESNGKEGECNQPVQADHPKTASPAPAPTSPIPIPSTPYRGKKTADQLHVLKQAFARTQWPGSPQYDELMARTGLPRPEVVRWFGDCRYVLKNGQLKWLESYQTMVEEEDYQKANLDMLKEHLETHGTLDETQVKELAKGSGLTEDLVHRWFTNRAPLLLAAKKAEEVEEGGAGTATAGEVEKEKESKVDGVPAAVAQQDQGSEEKTEKTEQSPPASTASSTSSTASTASTASTHETEKTMAADVKSTNPNQGVA